MFFDENDEKRERARAVREAAERAQNVREALAREKGGYAGRIAVIDRQIAELEIEIANEPELFRTMHLAERDVLLRRRDQLAGRIELVDAELASQRKVKR